MNTKKKLTKELISEISGVNIDIANIIFEYYGIYHDAAYLRAAKWVWEQYRSVGKTPAEKRRMATYGVYNFEFAV